MNVVPKRGRLCLSASDYPKVKPLYKCASGETNWCRRQTGRGGERKGGKLQDKVKGFKE